jgi:membrane-associated PAP2 superfamily phosphatase
MLVLALLLGPGLVVNGILKPEAGRPRPRNIVEFGGAESFRPVGSIDLSGDGKAFPSGHASVGFYFFVFYILWRRSRPRAARAALAAGLVGGAVIGLQRIAVGAHFLSDVIWSGGVVYLVPLCLDAVLPVPRNRLDPREG